MKKNKKEFIELIKKEREEIKLHFKNGTMNEYVKKRNSSTINTNSSKL